MSLSEQYQRFPKWGRISLGLFFIALIGIADYFNGIDFGVEIFFIVPIAVSAWYDGLKTGMLFAVISSVLIIVLNLPEAEKHFVYFWNSGFHLLSFGLVTVLISELRHSFDREWKLSRTDSLTGAMNKLAFNEITRMEVERSKRTKRPYSLAYIDLDNFKTVNDTYGHERGDSTLKKFTEVTKNSVRTMDTVSRLGGDEFAILFPEVGESDALDIMTRIQRAFRREMRAEELPVTMSVGLITINKAEESLNSLIRKADNLMYEVKKGGKDDIKQMIYNEESRSPA